MVGLDDWLSVARNADARDLREHILTGFKGGKPFAPYVPTVALHVPVERVLDFGCGVGRNFPYLKTIARIVTAFDLPPMVQRCRELSTVSVELLSSDWADLRTQRFDLIYASLVLQHIEPDRCRVYLDDFARMTPLVYLLTRTTTDFNTNVLDQCTASGAFEASACTIVEHDASTHGLKVLGVRPFEDLRASGEQAHCELLLRSRVYNAGQ